LNQSDVPELVWELRTTKPSVFHLPCYSTIASLPPWAPPVSSPFDLR
jgi:hypothetical protein